MRKLSNTHALAINKLMLPLISTLAYIDDENDINTYKMYADDIAHNVSCLLYTSPSPRDVEESRMPSSA